MAEGGGPDENMYVRLIGASAGSFDLLVVVLQILQVTTNGASRGP